MGFDFATEQGKYGEKLTLNSSWSEAVTQYVCKNDVKELCLNYAEGWQDDNVDFLNHLSNLEALSITHRTIKDISPIHALHSLRSLKVHTYCKTEIDFSQFPNVESCSLEWRAKARSIFECKTLKRLFLNSYAGTDTSKFSNLIQLEYLSLANAPIENIGGLHSLKDLRFLALNRLRKLRHLRGIEGLNCLEELEINDCWLLSSIAEIAALPNIKRFELCRNRDIQSIKPVENLTMLESFVFYESTNIVDGDLSPLTKLQQLANVSFQDRRHYSHKLVDFKDKSKTPSITRFDGSKSPIK